MITLLVGVCGLGAGVLMVGLTPSDGIEIAMAGMFIGAVMNAASNAALFTVLQSTIDPAMQGRVFSLGGSIANAALPLGMAIAGPLADWAGVQAMYIGAGILYILVGGASFFSRDLMRLEEQAGLRKPRAFQRSKVAVQQK
jgi:DHA3 family macrolide efflux protein-like MFS transporter